MLFHLRRDVCEMIVSLLFIYGIDNDIWLSVINIGQKNKYINNYAALNIAAGNAVA
jgi:hypothetical protein